MSKALARHADGSSNFQCKILLSSTQKVLEASLVQAINEVFSIKDAEVVVFYFAGHGSFTKNGGFLVTQDAQMHDEGLPMAQVITAANTSPSRERIIIIDCCHAGAIDELFGSAANIPLTEGVSILAACRSNQGAAERAGRGLFTSLVCDALDGGAADIRGFITIPSIYAYVDEMLTLFDQRPLFKSKRLKACVDSTGRAFNFR